MSEVVSPSPSPRKALHAKSASQANIIANRNSTIRVVPFTPPRPPNEKNAPGDRNEAEVQAPVDIVDALSPGSQSTSTNVVIHGDPSEDSRLFENDSPSVNGRQLAQTPTPTIPNITASSATSDDGQQSVASSARLPGLRRMSASGSLRTSSANTKRSLNVAISPQLKPTSRRKNAVAVNADSKTFTLVPSGSERSLTLNSRRPSYGPLHVPSRRSSNAQSRRSSASTNVIDFGASFRGGRRPSSPINSSALSMLSSRSNNTANDRRPSDVFTEERGSSPLTTIPDDTMSSISSFHDGPARKLFQTPLRQQRLQRLEVKRDGQEEQEKEGEEDEYVEKREEEDEDEEEEEEVQRQREREEEEEVEKEEEEQEEQEQEEEEEEEEALDMSVQNKGKQKMEEDGVDSQSPQSPSEAQESVVVQSPENSEERHQSDWAGEQETFSEQGTVTDQGDESFQHEPTEQELEQNRKAQLALRRSPTSSHDDIHRQVYRQVQRLQEIHENQLRLERASPVRKTPSPASSQSSYRMAGGLRKVPRTQDLRGNSRFQQHNPKIKQRTVEYYQPTLPEEPFEDEEDPRALYEPSLPIRPLDDGSPAPGPTIARVRAPTTLPGDFSLPVFQLPQNSGFFFQTRSQPSLVSLSASTISERTNYKLYGHSTPAQPSDGRSLMSYGSPSQPNYVVLAASSSPAISGHDVSLPLVASSEIGSNENYIVHGVSSSAPSVSDVSVVPVRTAVQKRSSDSILTRQSRHSKYRAFDRLGFYRQASFDSLRSLHTQPSFASLSSSQSTARVLLAVPTTLSVITQGVSTAVEARSRKRITLPSISPSPESMHSPVSPYQELAKHIRLETQSSLQPEVQRALSDSDNASEAEASGWQMSGAVSGFPGGVLQPSRSSSLTSPAAVYKRPGNIPIIRDHDEQSDGPAATQSLHTRLSKTGLGRLFRSNSTSSDYSSWIPTWAKVYYGSGERRRLLNKPSISSLASSGSDRARSQKAMSLNGHIGSPLASSLTSPSTTSLTSPLAANGTSNLKTGTRAESPFRVSSPRAIQASALGSIQETVALDVNNPQESTSKTSSRNPTPPVSLYTRRKLMHEARMGSGGQDSSRTIRRLPSKLARVKAKNAAKEANVAETGSVGHRSSRRISIGSIGPAMRLLLTPSKPHNTVHEAWSPHLRRDRLAQRASLWDPPSARWSMQSGVLGRRNVQVMLFATGFVMPLTWMVAAFLPLPADPKVQLRKEMAEVDEERGRERDRALKGKSTDLEHIAGSYMGNNGPGGATTDQVLMGPRPDDEERAIGGRIDEIEMSRAYYAADEKRFISARWWRMLNRIMAVFGVAIIATVIVLSVMGVRQRSRSAAIN